LQDSDIEAAEQQERPVTSRDMMDLDEEEIMVSQDQHQNLWQQSPSNELEPDAQEEIVDDMIAFLLSQVTLSASSEIEGPISRELNEPISRPSGGTLQDPANVLPVIPNLEMPPGLSSYNFAVLNLVDFPQEKGQCRSIIVCTACHKCIRTQKHDSLIEHFRDTHHEETIRFAYVPFPEYTAPPPVDRTWKSDSKRSQKYGPLRKWMAENAGRLTAPGFPSKTIPAIPFFPLQRVWGCTYPDCNLAFNAEDSAQRHFINIHGSNSREDDSFSKAERCTAQTLNCRGISGSLFRVTVTDLDLQPTTISADDILDSEIRLRPLPTASEHLKAAACSNVFLKRYPFHTIFPPTIEEYTPRVRKLFNLARATHSRKQQLDEQLTAITCFAYVSTIVKQMHSEQHLVNRLLGWKQQYVRSYFVESHHC
jgi:hypothetical protein